jgi:hypothetical protein
MDPGIPQTEESQTMSLQFVMPFPQSPGCAVYLNQLI